MSGLRGREDGQVGVHSRWTWGAPAGSWFLVKAGRQVPQRRGEAWEPSQGRERWQVSAL